MTAFAAMAPLHAELSGDDYRSRGVVTSAAERQRLAEELARERAQAAEREARHAAERAAAAEAERRRLADRPLGERLLHARCAACHRAEVVASVRHTAFGWRLVVERMRWWHGAQVAPTEVAPIVGHLAAAYPAAKSRTWLEWSLLAAACLSPVAIVLHRHRRCRGQPQGDTP